jgi:hypothetical protein
MFNMGNYLTQEQTHEVYGALGNEHGDIYIEWYNKNAEALIDNWVDANGYTTLEEIPHDELISYMANEFAKFVNGK